MSAPETNAGPWPDGNIEPDTAETFLATGPVAVPVPWSRGWAGGEFAEPGVASDAELARAACSDGRAFAAIYDRYSARLFDYCARMLRDRDAAADCVQDTFTTAATRLVQLREPDKLRPWLYAIARNESHRRLAARRRERLSDDLPETVAPEAGPEVRAQQGELAALIAAAARGLADRDRDVLELHYRHGLDGPELAAALGLSATNANTVVGRARTTIERSLGALLLARRCRAGVESCPELGEVIAGWDGAYSVLWRKRIARHVDRCSTCTSKQKSLVNPRALLAATPVFLPAPVWLRHQTLAHTAPLLVHSPAGASAAGTKSWWPHTHRVITPLRAAIAAPLIAVPVAAGMLLTSQPAPPAALVAQPAVVAPSGPGAGGRPHFGFDMPTTVLRAPVTTSEPGGLLVVPSSSAAPLLPRGPAPAPSRPLPPYTPPRPTHTTAPAPPPQDTGGSVSATRPPPETVPPVTTPAG